MTYPTGSRNGLRRSPMGAKRRETYITEAKFQAMVEELAEHCGWWHFHIYSPMKSPAGFPDLVMGRERLIFAELKSRSPKTGRAGKMAPAQIEFAHRFFAAPRGLGDAGSVDFPVSPTPRSEGSRNRDED